MLKGRSELASHDSRRAFGLAWLITAAFAMACAAEMTAQEVGAGGETGVQARPKFGTTNRTYVRVIGQEFSPSYGGYGVTGGVGRYPVTDNSLYAGLHLPDGAVVDYLEIDFYDGLDPQDVQLFLLDCAFSGFFCNGVANVNSFGAPGDGAISTSGFAYQVDNLNRALYLSAFFPVSNNPNLALYGAVVGYHLQVSSPPAFATFNDVPQTDPGFQFIEALARSGITGGCGGGNYCPDSPVTRRQMAVFLAKALGLSFN